MQSVVEPDYHSDAVSDAEPQRHAISIDDEHSHGLTNCVADELVDAEPKPNRQFQSVDDLECDIDPDPDCVAIWEPQSYRHAKLVSLSIPVSECESVGNADADSFHDL